MKYIAILGILAGWVLAQEPSSTKEAMKQIQFLVGEWKVTLTPEDGKGQPWEEMQAWEYKFDKDEVALQFTVKDGKKWKEGVLGYDPKKKLFKLEASRLDGKKAVYEGKLAAKELVLEEAADEKGAGEKISYNFLRDNRFIGEIARREPGQKAWAVTYSTQFTKQGVPFVKSEAPKCCVTGGTGTIEVSYQGKTYYVCCNSCKKEFVADPAKTLAAAKKEGYIK
jgi:YHS domain-containing protein